jgi:hypothetical protein
MISFEAATDGCPQIALGASYQTAAPATPCPGTQIARPLCPIKMRGTRNNTACCARLSTPPKQVREKISDLYSFVTRQPAASSPTQIAQVENRSVIEFLHPWLGTARLAVGEILFLDP